MKLSIQYIESVSKIHVVRCVVPDYKPVYWLVVKPPLNPQHGGINKESRVCDVRCKTFFLLRLSAGCRPGFSKNLIYILPVFRNVKDFKVPIIPNECPYFPTNTINQVNFLPLIQVLAHLLIFELDYIVLILNRSCFSPLDEQQGHGRGEYRPRDGDVTSQLSGERTTWRNIIWSNAQNKSKRSSPVLRDYKLTDHPSPIVALIIRKSTCRAYTITALLLKDPYKHHNQQ